jgi:uncharacterized protein (TIGR01777 family)
MRILITGGSGLIGGALVERLAAEGEREIVVLSRNPERMRGLPAGARAVGWDAETAAGWGELADGALGIVHLAGESVASGRWTDEKKRRIRDSRIASSRAVLAAVEAAAVKPRFLLQGSAVGFYGDRGDEVLTEDRAPGNDFLAGVCTEWEAVTEPVEALGVRRAVLRTGVVLAAEGGALPKMALPFKLGLGGRMGDGRQWMPWIHLADEVGAIRFLIDSEEAMGPFNLTAPRPETNRELSRVLARVLHRPSLFPAPRAALRLALGEMAEMLLASQRAVPGRLEAAGYRFLHPELEPALRDLLE